MPSLLFRNSSRVLWYFRSTTDRDSHHRARPYNNNVLCARCVRVVERLPHGEDERYCPPSLSGGASAKISNNETSLRDEHWVGWPSPSLPVSILSYSFDDASTDNLFPGTGRFF